MPLYNCLTHLYSYISWRDCVEIIGYSIVFYYFSRWLRNDYQKNLLGYFYSYCLTLLATYTLDLNSLFYFLMMACPIFILFLIVIHQEVLQKNFIMIKNIFQPLPHKEQDWLETLISSCLSAANKNKEIYCVIEQKDVLNTILNAEISFIADIQKNILDMFLDSENFDSTKMIWVGSTGKLNGINTVWNAYDDQWTTPSTQSLEKWQQNALFFTAKTDAIVFKITPKIITFSIITQGKMFNNISAAYALITLKKYLSYSGTEKGETIYAQQHKKHFFKQRST